MRGVALAGIACNAAKVSRPGCAFAGIRRTASEPGKPVRAFAGIACAAANPSKPCWDRLQCCESQQTWLCLCWDPPRCVRTRQIKALVSYTARGSGENQNRQSTRPPANFTRLRFLIACYWRQQLGNKPRLQREKIRILLQPRNTIWFKFFPMFSE